jgi:hypothetical protein
MGEENKDIHPAFELAHSEGLRAITQQQATLSSIQQRASWVLSVATIATSFLGGVALNKEQPKGWDWLAVGLFAAVALLVLAVLIPRRGWNFRTKPKIILEDYAKVDPDNQYKPVGEPIPSEQMYAYLAGFLESNYNSNEKKLERLMNLYLLSNFVLTLEVTAWILVLAQG